MVSIFPFVLGFMTAVAFSEVGLTVGVAADGLYSWLKERILARPGGWMSLAEWMDEVLYHPQWGYYMQWKKKIGKDGDYYTSSSFATVFGDLLAEALCGLLRTLSVPQYHIVELGGGDGRLAASVLDAFQRHPDVYEKVTYYMVEKSPYHRHRQQETLARHRHRVAIVDEVDELAPFSGIIYSNEFFDALPVHGLVGQGDMWHEVGVTWDETSGRFVEKRVPCRDERLLSVLAEWGVRPEKESRVEISLDAVAWMQKLAQVMTSGYVLTIDYGYWSDDGRCRPDGTVRAFRAHQLTSDVWAYPGEQDVTTDVHFSLLLREGQKGGLEPVWKGTQRDFLLRLGILAELTDGINDPWSAAARKNRMIRQLVFDETGMGSRFSVLVQAKNVQLPKRLHGLKRSFALTDGG